MLARSSLSRAIVVALVLGGAAFPSRAAAYATNPATLWTIAGTGAACATSTDTSCDGGGVATSAQLHSPYGVAVDGAGDVYVADFSDNKIRKVTPGGAITTIAGTGAACATSTGTSCDGFGA